MKQREELREEIIAEYVKGDVSLRELGAKYGVAHSTLGRWVKLRGQKSRNSGSKGNHVEENMALEIKELRKKLQKAELHAKLLDAMIEIAEEQFNIPIRKKSGPRR